MSFLSKKMGLIRDIFLCRGQEKFVFCKDIALFTTV
jgi:hypothetical protein